MTNTLYGYDHLALGLARGNPGLGRGATARSGGKAHLYNAETGRTACGRKAGSMAVSLVPETVTETTWATQIVLCSACREAVGR